MTTMTVSTVACVGCDQPEGEVSLTREGVLVCRLCVLKHRVPVCLRCNTLTLQSRRAGQEIWCSDCYATPLDCHGCGVTLDLFVRGRDGHPRCLPCEQSHERCGLCGIGEREPVTLFDGVRCCATCLSRLRLCAACDGYSTGERCRKCHAPVTSCLFCKEVAHGGFTWSKQFHVCQRCVPSVEGTCSGCARPVKRGEHHRAPYGICCAACAETVVSDAARLPALLARAHDLIAEVAGLRLVVMPTVRLARPLELVGQGYEGEDIDGFYAPSSHEIVIASGYTELITLSLLAHELVHAWQNENGLSGCEKQLLEGFAVWVEMRVLYRLKAPAVAANHVSRRDRVYGQGLRKCLSIEVACGVDGLLAFVRENLRFPFWVNLKGAFGDLFLAA